MSLYGRSIKIDGAPSGLAMGGGGNGQYLAAFDREFAALEQAEAVCRARSARPRGRENLGEAGAAD